MFKLKESISDWKQKLNSSNSLMNNDIEELESHLLDEIDALKEKDLNEEEAFFVASSRLGGVDLLSSEFSKVNTRSMYLKKLVWFISGYILINFIRELIYIITTFLILAIDKTNIVNLFGYDYCYLSMGISVAFLLIFLYFLIAQKYQMLSKIQSIFSYLYNSKKVILLLIYVVFIVMNSIGNFLIHVISIRIINIPNYSEILRSNTYVGMIWSMILCLSFILIAFRKNKKEQVA